MPTPKPADTVSDELCRYVLAEPAVVRRQLRAGTILLLDNPGDAFSLVVDGALALQLGRRNGGSITIEVLGPGACIPPAARTTSARQPLVLSALVPSTVARVPTVSFERVVRQHPFLAPMVGVKMAQQHGELLERVASLAERSPTRRLAATLLYLAGSVGQRCTLAEGMRVPLPQHVIGEAADLSRQTANRCLRQMQAMGLLRVERGMVCVLDAMALEAVAAGAPVVPVWKPAETCTFARPGEPLTCFPLRRASARKTHHG